MDDRLEEIVKEIIKEPGRQPKGWLYKMIRRLVDGESARAICSLFRISETMTAKEESARLDGWFGYRIWIWGEKWGNVVVCLNRGDKEEIAQRTLRAALMMIGHWYSQKPGGTSAFPSTHSLEGKTETGPPRAVPVEKAALALVLRSSKVKDLPPVSELLSVQRVIDLIADAVYFRCAPLSEADAKEKELGLTGNADLTAAPQREHDVYLRLEVEEGGDLMDAESPFALKNRLRDRPPRPIRLTRRERLDCPAESLHDFHSI